MWHIIGRYFVYPVIFALFFAPLSRVVILLSTGSLPAFYAKILQYDGSKKFR